MKNKTEESRTIKLKTKTSLWGLNFLTVYLWAFAVTRNASEAVCLSWLKSPAKKRDRQGWVYFSLAEVSKATTMDRESVSRAFKRLKAKGLIDLRTPKANSGCKARSRARLRLKPILGLLGLPAGKDTPSVFLKLYDPLDGEVALGLKPLTLKERVLFSDLERRKDFEKADAVSCSLAWLADDLGDSKGHISRYLHSLEAKGWIDINDHGRFMLPLKVKGKTIKVYRHKGKAQLTKAKTLIAKGKAKPKK